MGCILYALCYFKNPFDPIYERGDSIALAVISGNISFPESSIYSEVGEMKQILIFFFIIYVSIFFFPGLARADPIYDESEYE